MYAHPSAGEKSSSERVNLTVVPAGKWSGTTSGIIGGIEVENKVFTVWRLQETYSEGLKANGSRMDSGAGAVARSVRGENFTSISDQAHQFPSR